MAGDGLDLLERALAEHAGEDTNRRKRAVNWSQSLVKLTTTSRCRIPPGIEDKWGLAVHRSNCGLLALIQHAWVSVDSVLHIWDYCQEDSPIVTFTADSAIITVNVCQPQPGVLPSASWLLLVVATRRSISLVGIELVPGHPRIRLVGLPGYTLSTEGAIFHCIRCNLAGHIFLLCGAPQVYELVYTSEPGWFRPSIQLVRHTGGWWPWVRDFVSIVPQAPCRIRLLECAAHDYVVTVDDLSSIRLLRSFREGGTTILEELGTLTTQRMDRRITELMHLSLASCTVAHVSLIIGLDGYLHLHILTAAGDRLHFVCSAAWPHGPPCIGVVVPPSCISEPYTQTAAEADKQFFGFWLKDFVQGSINSGSGGQSLFQNAAGLTITRSACMEYPSEPCFCSAGVCLRVLRQSSGIAPTDIAISVCTEDHASGEIHSACLELQKTLELTSPIFDICEDHPATICEPALDGDPGGMCRNRTFAVLLQDGVKIIQISHQPWDFGRSPSTPNECCSHLLQLDLARLGRMRGMCQWMWSLDDARAPPSFESQQHHMTVTKSLPPANLGRWFRGFLHCLAIMLSPIWNVPLVRAVGSRPGVLNFYKRRRVTSYSFALSEASVQHTLAQLRLVLNFVAKGSGIQPLGLGRPPSTPAPSSVAVRSRLYVNQSSDSSGIPVAVLQLLSDVLDIAGRLDQMLGLLCVIHHISDRVLQSAALPADVLSTLQLRPCSELLTSAEALQPLVHLCTAAICVAEGSPLTSARTGLVESGGSTICKDLQAMCPLIFAQVDLNSCLGLRSSSATTLQPRSVEVGAIAIGTVAASFLEMPTAQWEALLRGVEESSCDIAQKMCTNKLEQLSEISGDSEAIVARALALLFAFVKAASREAADVSRTALETLLTRTCTLRFPPVTIRDTKPSVASTLVEDASVVGLPFVHAAVLDCLITAADTDIMGVASSAGARALLDYILASRCLDMEGFLCRRYNSNRMAAEYLWRSYSIHNPARASEVLLQLAEWPGRSCKLDDRIRYLDLARQHSQHCSERAPQASADIELQLHVARRVQIPLLNDLMQIACNTVLESVVSSDASARLEGLEQLVSLKKLYEIAIHFGLYHILLIIADLSDGEHSREDTSWAWISLFCPPRSCAYCLPPSNFAPEQDVVSLASQFFPLLVVRKGSFYPNTAGSHRKGDEALAPGSCAPRNASDCLQSRAMSLIEELAQCTQLRGSLWDARCIATVLEYSSCAWLSFLDANNVEIQRLTSHSKNTIASSPMSCRSWVALDLLHKEPFHFSLVDIVKFYGQMLGCTKTWVRELQAMLPEGCNWYFVDEDALQVHLSEVALLVLDRWLQEVHERRLDGPHVIAEFREAWQQSGEALVAGLALRLNGLQYHHSSAKRLLQEAHRIEAEVRKLSGQLSAALALQQMHFKAPVSQAS